MGTLGDATARQLVYLLLRSCGGRSVHDIIRRYVVRVQLDTL